MPYTCIIICTFAEEQLLSHESMYWICARQCWVAGCPLLLCTTRTTRVQNGLFCSIINFPQPEALYIFCSWSCLSLRSVNLLFSSSNKFKGWHCLHYTTEWKLCVTICWILFKAWFCSCTNCRSYAIGYTPVFRVFCRSITWKGYLENSHTKIHMGQCT